MTKKFDLGFAKTRAGFTKSSSSAKKDMKPIFLIDHRFRHPYYTPENQFEGVYRHKKNDQTFSFNFKFNGTKIFEILLDRPRKISKFTICILRFHSIF